MTQQTIGIGASANDGTGDTPRAAFNKVNQNFTELYGGFLATVTTQALARTALGYGSVALLNSVSLTTNISGILPVANGGTGTASPALVAGTGVTITGSWPNQTINASGGGSFSGGAIAAPIQISGGTQTTNNPIEDNTQTWNASGVTFTGYRMNITNTASAAGSLLMDLQVGSTSKFNVRKDGQVTATAADYQTPAFNLSGMGGLGSNGSALYLTNVGFSNAAGLYSTSFFIGANLDVFLTRKAAANLQLGAADAAAPVAQTLTAQSVVAGTSNTAGANLTVQGSAGTGTGAGGSIIFQTAAAGSTGTAQNAFGTALTIAADKSATFAGAGSFGGQLSVSGNCNLANVVASGAGNFGGGFGFQFDSFFTQPVSGTVSLKNGTASQTFRLYGTASGGNDAWAEFQHTTGGDLYISTKQAGGGTAGRLAFAQASTVLFDYGLTTASYWTFNANVAVKANVFSLYAGANIGAQWFGGSPQQFSLASGSNIGFNPNASITGSNDVALARNAAGVLEINSGTAGTYRDLKLRNLIFSDGTQLATSPARALLTTITPTAVASIAYTSIPSGYSKFEIEFDNVTNANGGANEAPLIALSANNGTTYDSSQCGAANTGLSGAMFGRVSIAPVGVTANKIAEGAATQGTVYWPLAGKWTSQTGVTNAIRFAWSGGSNFVAQGAIRIYGIV